ncbi:MAG: hypothetical protein R3C25_09725 [Hyphomonadaceae bacterium]
MSRQFSTVLEIYLNHGPVGLNRASTLTRAARRQGMDKAQPNPPFSQNSPYTYWTHRFRHLLVRQPARFFAAASIGPSCALARAQQQLNELLRRRARLNWRTAAAWLQALVLVGVFSLWV